MAIDERLPRAPRHLEAPGKRLWRRITAEYELGTAELTLLEQACRTSDELARLQDALRGAETVVEGSQGQDRVHPAYSEARAHRLALRTILASLGVEEADADSRSQAARALARRRWSRHGT